jgi:hypothetical protein
MLDPGSQIAEYVNGTWAAHHAGRRPNPDITSARGHL